MISRCRSFCKYFTSFNLKKKNPNIFFHPLFIDCSKIHMKINKRQEVIELSSFKFHWEMHRFHLQIRKGSVKALLWLKNNSVCCFVVSTASYCTALFLCPEWAWEHCSPERTKGVLHISSKNFALFWLSFCIYNNLKQKWSSEREEIIFHRLNWASGFIPASCYRNPSSCLNKFEEAFIKGQPHLKDDIYFMIDVQLCSMFKRRFFLQQLWKCEVAYECFIELI